MRVEIREVAMSTQYFLSEISRRSFTSNNAPVLILKSACSSVDERLGQKTSLWSPPVVSNECDDNDCIPGREAGGHSHPRNVHEAEIDIEEGKVDDAVVRNVHEHEWNESLHNSLLKRSASL